jgi:hypothetical protein
MAIFRGGKRLGPFDLRIGLPRGREYDNIPGDPRLQQRANPETTINRFRAAISKGEGVARPSRFLVRVNLPQGGINLQGIFQNQEETTTDTELGRLQGTRQALASTKPRDW